MSKKNTKNLTDNEPVYKYNKVFVHEQRSPTNTNFNYIRAQKSAEYGVDRAKMQTSPDQNLNARSNLQ